MFSVYLKYSFDFKILLNIFQLKIQKKNIFLHPFCAVSNSIYYVLYSSANKLHSFPIHEIRNLNYVVTDKNKWEKIINEILELKEKEKNLPSTLTFRDIDELLEVETKSLRRKYLNFLFKKEMIKLAGIEKRKKRRLERESAVHKNDQSKHLKYGLGYNTLFLAFRKYSLHKFYNLRLANSALFGPKLVFDLSYDEYMWKKERRDCVAQLRHVYGSNRTNIEPYNIYFCNAKSESRCVQYLQQEMPHINDSLISVTELSYLDIFPKENLVYLSPHAPETLKTYDHKAIYIIGAFVDTVKREHISLHKAEEEGIKSYSLPLDKYILWGSGSKSLTINQVFEIMLTLRDTGDWIQAFKHIPTRKMQKPSITEAELVSQ